MLANVTKFETINVYDFNIDVLWATYGIAIFATGFAILLGFIRYLKNTGIDRNRDLSVIIIADRAGDIGGRPLGTNLRRRTPMHAAVESPLLQTADVSREPR